MRYRQSRASGFKSPPREEAQMSWTIWWDMHHRSGSEGWNRAVESNEEDALLRAERFLLDGDPGRARPISSFAGLRCQLRTASAPLLLSRLAVQFKTDDSSVYDGTCRSARGSRFGIGRIPL
jgi:hypothetical protein